MWGERERGSKKVGRRLSPKPERAHILLSFPPPPQHTHTNQPSFPPATTTMHGRKKATAPPTAEASAAAREKLEKARALMQLAVKSVRRLALLLPLPLRGCHVLGVRRTARPMRAAVAKRPHSPPCSVLPPPHQLRSTTTTEADMALNGKILSAVPDVSSLWNHRRRAILAREARCGFCHSSPSIPVPPPLTPLTLPSNVPRSPSASAAVLAAELPLTEAAIARNPKSYPAWHHRQWVLARFSDSPSPSPSPSTTPPPWCVAELALCGKLLDLDERNFHCWNYRQWVAETGRVPVEDELAHTLARIRRNFSNYSAWHHRSHLLARQAGAAVVAAAAAEAGAASVDGAAAAVPAPSPPAVPLSALGRELELVRQAAFTEPDDQSPWFYRRWCVAEACRHVGAGGEAEAAALALLAEDCAHLRELAEAEPGCKCEFGEAGGGGDGLGRRGDESGHPAPSRGCRGVSATGAGKGTNEPGVCSLVQGPWGKQQHHQPPSLTIPPSHPAGPVLGLVQTTQAVQAAMVGTSPHGAASGPSPPTSSLLTPDELQAALAKLTAIDALHTNYYDHLREERGEGEGRS
jgi:hypothetical protein